MKIYELVNELMMVPAVNDVEVCISKKGKEELLKDKALNCFDIESTDNDSGAETFYLYIGECE